MTAKMCPTKGGLYSQVKGETLSFTELYPHTRPPRTTATASCKSMQQAETCRMFFSSYIKKTGYGLVRMSNFLP